MLSGKAKNPPAQNQSETSRVRPPQFAIGSDQFLTRFLHFGVCVGETIGLAKNLSKGRPLQFAIGSHQFLTRLLHFGGLCGGDHRAGPEDPEHTDRQTDGQTGRQTARQTNKQTRQKLGRPNLLSVLISSLLDFFILGACVGGTIGQAQEIQSTQTDRRTVHKKQYCQLDF